MSAAHPLARWLPPLALSALLALSLACGGGAKARAAKLREENGRLKAEVAATDEAARAGHAYANQLTGKPDGAALSLVYTAEDIQKLAAAVLPYKMPAKSFNAQLAGEFHVEALTDVQLQPGNRLTCKVHYRGVGIRYQGAVPEPYKAQVKRFVDGVQAGVVSDLDVQLATTGEVIIARAKAKRSQLRKNRDAGNEARLTNELNARVLRRGLAIDAAIAGAGFKIFGVTTTQTHVAVVYK